MCAVSVSSATIFVKLKPSKNWNWPDSKFYSSQLQLICNQISEQMKSVCCNFNAELSEGI